jgi:imidazole glycerol-phosphate synthase subunit HisF
MLRPRIIPCLLIHKGGLVKTVNFKNPKYVGDPINAVRIFNEKEVDELIVLDIDASSNNVEPDFKTISHLAAECRMPLCYGGGIKTSEQAQHIFSLGVEKVALSSIAVEQPELIKKIANIVGNQSVVIVMDVKKHKLTGKYEIRTHNGQISTGINPLVFAKKMEDFGAGEIVINSIDNDGVMKGYDLSLVENLKKIVNVPITVLGGAGSLNDIGNLIKLHGTLGAAAGSLFVFKGKYKAVLINYPNREEKDKLVKDNLTVHYQ